MAGGKRRDGARFVIHSLFGAVTGGFLSLVTAARISLRHPGSVLAFVLPLAFGAVVGGLLAGFFGERFWYWVAGKDDDDSSLLD